MSRRIDLEAAKKAARKEQHKKELRSKRIRTQLIWTAALVCALAAVIAVIVGINASINSTKTKNGTYMRETVIAKNSYGEVNAAMIAYYIGEDYANLLGSSDDQTLAIMGIDTAKKLSEMRYDGTQTWFDVLASDACRNASEWLAYCLAAQKNDCTLTESELSALNKRAERVDLSAYAGGITVNDVVDALKIQALGEKYKAIVASENTAEAKAIEKEIKNNPTKYLVTDYRYYYIAYEVEGSDMSMPIGPDVSMEEISIDVTSTEESSEEQSEDVSGEETSGEETSAEVVILTREEAFAEADKIAAAKSEQEFVRLIAEFINTHFESYSEEEADKVAGEYVVNSATVTNELLAKWIYNSKRALYDTAVLESGSNGLQVVMLTSLPEVKQSAPTVNISVIRVFDEETARLAQEHATTGGEDAFNEACIIYSNDISSRYDCGRISDYTDQIGCDELNEWLFDSPTVGEVKTFKGSRGWYVVRYDGEGLGSIRGKISSQISQEQISAAQKNIISSYRVTTYDAKLKDLIDY